MNFCIGPKTSAAKQRGLQEKSGELKGKDQIPKLEGKTLCQKIICIEMCLTPTKG